MKSLLAAKFVAGKDPTRWIVIATAEVGGKPQFTFITFISLLQVCRMLRFERCAICPVLSGITPFLLLDGKASVE